MDVHESRRSLGKRNSDIDLVLLTRFNLPSGGIEARIRADDEWLARRWTLFERYCAPAVAAQTDDELSWIIYFDPESPSWLRDAIAPYVAQGLFTPIYRAEVPRESLLSDLRSVTRGAPMLVTTNLDNDDGIAVDFVERLRSAISFGDRRAVFFVNGLIKGADAVYFRTDRDNAFCSVAEPAESPVTCWSDWHIMLRRSMPVVELEGPPAWLQVVHGQNVSNRIRGRLISATRWSALFPGSLQDVAEPSSSSILRDRLIVAPTRWVSTTSRSLARRVAVRVLGKDGMLRLKSSLRGLIRRQPKT